MNEDDRVRVLALAKLGKGGVIREAFARSDADLVGFVDADGATPPSELLRLTAATEHADGAIASRRHPAAVLPVGRSASRRLFSVALPSACGRFSGCPMATREPSPVVTPYTGSPWAASAPTTS
jgi:glycosyltransferase involved in cell wall biosynthesis